MAVVLVVAARPGTAAALREALLPVGHEVREVDRLPEPPEADLVLLDLAGEPEALDIVRRMKSSSDARLAGVRLGVVGATGSDHERLEAAIEGVLLYVARPVDRQRVGRDVARLLAGEPEAVQRKKVQDAALRALVRKERSERAKPRRRDAGKRHAAPRAAASPSSLHRRLGELNERQRAVIEAIATSDTREEARLRLGISRSLLGATLRSAAHRLHYASVSDLVASVRQELAGDVGGAAERRHLLFQPIVSVGTGHTLAFEAIAYATTPDGPDEPITATARWAVGAAVEAAARWRATEEWADVGVSVDVSSRHLAAPGAADDILALVAEAGLPPEAVTLEVADTVEVAASEAASAAWRALRRAGVRLCVDHFGTERSALASLLHLAVDVVKLDASLLHWPAMADVGMVTGLVSFAGAIAPVVIADGVATSDRLWSLEVAGCRAVQGPLVGKPGDAPTDRVGVSSPELTIPSG